MTLPIQYRDGGGTIWKLQTEPGSEAEQNYPIHSLPAEVKANIADTATRLAAVVTALTNMAGYTDGLEALVTTLNGYVDGLEGLVGTTNTSLATLQGYVDQLEGYTDTLEALAGALNPSTAGTPFQKSAGTSPVQLDSVVVTTGCWIKNVSTGTQLVYVGRSGVTTSTGYQLAVGEDRFFPCRNTNEWYVIASAASSNSGVLPI